MSIEEIHAKSILRKAKKIDSWFVSRYGMNLYRGCCHNCSYCDGRAEGYYVEGEFGRDVAVKVNAPEKLEHELDPAGKRKPLEKGFVMVGGGVGDSYQPAEQKYKLTARVLEVLRKRGLPVHILTKSVLVERDRDIISGINEMSRAVVSFSFSSVDDGISRVFEPGVPAPSRRLEALRSFAAAGIPCGMFLMPVIPFVTDTPEMIERAVRAAAGAGAGFVVFGGMTLKRGRQKEHFMGVYGGQYPRLATECESIYGDNKWGMPAEEYYCALNSIFLAAARQYRVPVRMPPEIFGDILGDNEKVIVFLEHMDYMLRMKGKKSPYGYAAYSVSKLKGHLCGATGDLRNLKGVGPVTEKIIREILNTGDCAYYRKITESMQGSG